MEEFNFVDGTDPAESIIAAIEKQTGEKIFTLRVFKNETENEIHFLAVLENKEVLEGHVSVAVSGKELALRVRAIYL